MPFGQQTVHTTAGSLVCSLIDLVEVALPTVAHFMGAAAALQLADSAPARWQERQSLADGSPLARLCGGCASVHAVILPSVRGLNVAYQ